MRDRKKRITVVIMICILLVVVSGCSKEKSSDTLEEVQQREKTESGDGADGRYRTCEESRERRCDLCICMRAGGKSRGL